VIACLVAAIVVTLAQYLRLSDRRLLPLLGLFVCLAIAHSRGEWEPVGRVFHFGAVGMGLLEVFVLRRGEAR
jgi:hypothetical protein